MQVEIPFAPEQASTVSGEVDTLYAFLWALTIFFGVLISLTIIYFAVKYRRRSESEVPRPVAGSIKLEIAWTVIPFLIAMGIFVWAASIYYKLYRVPNNATEIFVVGKQWMWKFQHIDGQREINELHVPIGRKVKLTMTTEDVIHSMFIPAFRVKMDVVPGRYSHVWFEATKAGRYHIFCAEYCGTSHSGMIGTVVVMEPADYQAWLAGGTAEGSLASQGEKVFQDRACHTCHFTGRAPNLVGLFGKNEVLADGSSIKVDEAYIRESILDPSRKVVRGYPSPSQMPSYRGMSEEELIQLIAYLRSLTQQPASATGSPMPPLPAGGPATGSSGLTTRNGNSSIR
jgi:cytochrome c oxidase subunit 2